MLAISDARRAGRHIVRVALPLLTLVACAYILSAEVTADTLVALPAQLADIHWSGWLGAVSLTIVSLWAVGRYDGVAHAHFATRIPDHRARWTGTIAVSMAQTLGFGMFTGALARWRMLPDLSIKSAFQISAFVSISFIASWALVTATAMLLLPAPTWSFWPALTAFICVPFGTWLLFRHPQLHLQSLHPSFANISMRLPSLKSAGAIVICSAMDTIAAAGALYLLLPVNADVSFATFIPLFLLALGAGLISNTPGGVGPFEVMMLGLMPLVPVENILASIIAFRVVYYGGPAILAFVSLLFPFKARIQQRPQIVPSIAQAQNSEIGVIKQNGGYVLPSSEGACAVWPTGQTLTMLCNPISGTVSSNLTTLKNEAALKGVVPMLYKCNRKTANAARATNWKVMHISDDAILFPETFSLDSPSRRTLRRKLRAAEKAGVSISTYDVQPWHDMARVDRIWQARNGSARGGTMGQFCPTYLEDHFIARAYKDGALIAFATFQCSIHEWCLDVMRHVDDVPDGTMHTLVAQAIAEARRAGIQRLSLAATPACPDPSSVFYRWAAVKVVEKSGGLGLRQFKSAFAPLWQPRYAAAPNVAGLVIGLCDIAKEVHQPQKPPTETVPKIHNLDENYELAS